MKKITIDDLKNKVRTMTKLGYGDNVCGCLEIAKFMKNEKYTLIYQGLLNLKLAEGHYPKFASEYIYNTFIIFVSEMRQYFDNGDANELITCL